MPASTTLFRARVPTDRLKRVEKILSKMGLKPGDALNMLLAQIELRGGMPFAVTSLAPPLLTPEEQGKVWNDHLGAY
jgi:addiction module RelB/DinJ family antitoxin